ncbi:TonB-dependent receptor [Colwelliaceae bacterium 6471]
MKFKKLFLASSIAISFIPTTSFAAELSSTNDDETIETITVHSDFRQQNLQKTASSLSIISNDNIRMRNAQNLEEITAAIPNVNFASGTQRARYYQIRGIGERSQFKEPINPSVGILIDDIDFTGMGSVASTFDVAQTEIYRGPQGTRFGANAMAGLISISSNTPSDVFEGNSRLSVGNYGSYGAGIALSGPATLSTNYRLAVEKYQSDGFIENNYLGRDDTNNRDELSVRAKLAITASEDLKIDLTLLHFNFDNGYDAFSLDNTRTTFSNTPGFDRQKTSALGAKFSYSGFQNFDLVTLVSAADSDLDYGYDEDWAYGEYDWDSGACLSTAGCFADAWGYSSIDQYFRKRSTYTGEVRLLSKENQAIFNNTTDWLIGFYAKKDQEKLARQYTYLASDYSSSFDTDTYALFGQLDSQLSAQLTLTTGLRAEKRQADYTNSDLLSFAPSDTMVGGKVVLAYQQDLDTLIYASINRGYKMGGVNTDGSLPIDLRQFSPEYLWNYELGYKYSFLNNAAYIRAAIFHMDRQDMQVKTDFLALRDDGSTEFVSYLGNAASGHNQGVEIESAWQVNPLVEFYGALGLLNTEFDQYTRASGDNLSGRDQAHAPKYQFNLGVNYRPGEQWLINISVDGKDDFYFSNSHEQKSQAIEIVNASLSYIQEHWQIKLWARNLSDKEYATRGFYFGNDPRDYYQAKAYYQYAEPAVFGLTFDYQF